MKNRLIILKIFLIFTICLFLSITADIVFKYRVLAFQGDKSLIQGQLSDKIQPYVITPKEKQPKLTFPKPEDNNNKLEIPQIPRQWQIPQIPQQWPNPQITVPSQIPEFAIPPQIPSVVKGDVNSSESTTNLDIGQFNIPTKIPSELKDNYLELLKDQIEFNKAEVKYRMKALEKLSENFDSDLSVRHGAFRLQQTFGWVSMIAVHLLLAAGLFLSLRESKAASKLRKKSDSELNISLQGIAAKTSLQSILVLVMTLAFYFLYIKYVFPISELKP